GSGRFRPWLRHPRTFLFDQSRWISIPISHQLVFSGASVGSFARLRAEIALWSKDQRELPVLPFEPRASGRRHHQPLSSTDLRRIRDRLRTLSRSWGAACSQARAERAAARIG